MCRSNPWQELCFNWGSHFLSFFLKFFWIFVRNFKLTRNTLSLSKILLWKCINLDSHRFELIPAACQGFGTPYELKTKLSIFVGSNYKIFLLLWSLKLTWNNCEKSHVFTLSTRFLQAWPFVSVLMQNLTHCWYSFQKWLIIEYCCVSLKELWRSIDPSGKSLPKLKIYNQVKYAKPHWKKLLTFIIKDIKTMWLVMGRVTMPNCSNLQCLSFCMNSGIALTPW